MLSRRFSLSGRTNCHDRSIPTGRSLLLVHVPVCMRVCGCACVCVAVRVSVCVEVCASVRAFEDVLVRAREDGSVRAREHASEGSGDV